MVFLFLYQWGFLIFIFIIIYILISFFSTRMGLILCYSSIESEAFPRKY